MSDGLTNVGVTRRQVIDLWPVEVRAAGSHEVPGIGAAEAAVHALTLLESRVGDLRCAQDRGPAAGGAEGLEVDNDCRMRRHRLAVQSYRVGRQAAWNPADLLLVHEYAADVVFRHERLDDR